MQNSVLLHNKKSEKTLKHWLRNGEHWIWINASAIAICIIMVLGLISLISFKGLIHFWPSTVWQITVSTNNTQSQWLGELVERETVNNRINDKIIKEKRSLYKIGNRQEFSLDFKWFVDESIVKKEKLSQAMVIERLEWGNAYGFFDTLNWSGKKYNNIEKLNQALQETQQLKKEINTIERKVIGKTNAQLEKIRQQEKKITTNQSLKPYQVKNQLATLEKDKNKLHNDYTKIKKKLDQLYQQLEHKGFIAIRLSNNSKKKIMLSEIVDIFLPNDMNFLQKSFHYVKKIWQFVSENPREANTEGGIFPAIFGTVILVILMTIFVTPLGIITAIYLKEYAKQGLVVRLIRISVNNLAGVPSIVYGVFGLGFFVYFLGGSIDELFYNYNLPSPTFGSPNMLWASLTLALLTLPVVIVSTEEGLNRIPRSIREGSLALGATKFETIWRTILPIISPAIMTGIILAIARAAGEVAPLMLVGVVKLAPDLVIDSTSPFLHLDRQFMHLGFHIFDVGFQSPNIEAARPLVYATATLLVIIILLLNITAIKIRNHLREKYKPLES